MIHIIRTNPCVGCHSSIPIHVIPGSIDQLPSCLHSSVFRTSQIIPVISVPEPSIPHISIRIKCIPFSANILPSIGRPASIILLPPPAYMIFLPGTRLGCNRHRNYHKCQNKYTQISYPISLLHMLSSFI